MKSAHYGWLIEYAEEEAFLAAIRQARRKWGARIRAYAPYPVEGMDDALSYRPSPIPAIMLCAGVLGAAGAFYLQWYAAHDYPLNIGGRPLGSWPSFIPITFELTVLTSALTGLFALLILARFPRLDHPVFSVPAFLRASEDRFFVGVVDAEGQISREDVTAAMPQALSVEEMEP